MAIDANSYGSTAGVAKLTPRYSNGAGDFDEGTNPAISTVESWIDQVSAILNTTLSDERFDVPIVQADAVRMLALFVNQEAASLVEASHNAGRFGPSNKNPGAGRFDLIFKDVATFVKNMAGGLEKLGASRGTTQTNLGSVSLIRADGYSNDKDAVTNSYL